MYKKIIAVSFFISALILPYSVSIASEINLPRTGQTLCYNDTGTVIDCSYTGQDGEFQAGQPWPSPRFNDNGNGTVTDNLTGLIWLKNANCSATLGGVNKTTTLTWDNAIIWSNNLASGACGLTDGSIAGQWRLPNRKELQTLIDRSKSSPPLPTGHPFSNVILAHYWTSSTYARFTDQAWWVDMYRGSVIGDYPRKTDVNYVWPVRGGL